MRSSKYLAVLSLLMNFTNTNTNTNANANANIKVKGGLGSEEDKNSMSYENFLSVEEIQILSKLFTQGLIVLNSDQTQFEISSKFVDSLIESGEISASDIQLASECMTICDSMKK